MDGSTSRRRFLRGIIAGGITTFAGCPVGPPQPPQQTTNVPGTQTTSGPTTASATKTPPETTESPPSNIGLETLVDGLRAPLAMVFPPRDNRRYIATQRGLVHVHESDGLRDEPLIDLRDDVIVFNEQGLLGMALHPNFEENKRLFLRYSSPSRPGTPDEYSHTFVLSEVTVNDAGTKVVPDSERAILEIPEPHRVHNAGDIVFGPDGYLYIPTGDGGDHGDIGDGHVDDWYESNLGGNGQDVQENLLGSILRIDVDSEETIREEERPYGIPRGNPLVDQEGLDEHFAWGFRNPWQISFDGDTLYVGDVGQALFEEINIVENGGNYGWNVKEGPDCFNTFDMQNPRDECPEKTPDSVRDGEPLIDPVIAYPNAEPSSDSINGVAVIGGEIYRGSALPGLKGRYLFGDLRPKGRLFVGTPPHRSEQDGWSSELIHIRQRRVETLERLLAISGGPDGELYVLGGGGVHRIIP